jgi:hypothetical protein
MALGKRLINTNDAGGGSIAKWVAATGSGIAYTTDPSAATGWTSAGNPFGSRGEGVLWNGTAWVATGRSTYAGAYSPDGINWTSITTITPGGSGIGWNGDYWLMTTDSSAYYTSDATGATGWTQVTNGINGTTSGSANNILWDGSDWLVAGIKLWRINGSNPNGTATTVLSGNVWYQVGWQGSTGNVIIGTRNGGSTNAYYMTSFTSSPISVSINTSGVETGVVATSQGAAITSTSSFVRYSSDGTSYTTGGTFLIGGGNFNGTHTVIGDGVNTGRLRIVSGENINFDLSTISPTDTGLGVAIRNIGSDNDQYRFV